MLVYSLINLRLENLSTICTSDTIHEYDKEIFLSDPITFLNNPTLFAFNSLMSLKLNVTRIATPLVAAPANEFQTLLTVLKQAQGINAKVMGADKKTVISLDLGPYKPAK